MIPVSGIAPDSTLREVSKKADPDERAATSEHDAQAQAKTLAALARQQQRFNKMAMERGELEREQEALDTLLLAQLKHDDEVLKAWLRLA